METWDDEARERRRAREAIRHLWQNHGITYRPIVMIVYGMACVPGRKYREVLEDWTLWAYKVPDMPERSVEVWHSEICRRLLQAGADVSHGVGQWFEERAKEVRKIEN